MKIHWIEKPSDVRTCCGRSIYERGISVYRGAPKRKRVWECLECKEKVSREPFKKRSPRVSNRRQVPRP